MVSISIVSPNSLERTQKEWGKERMTQHGRAGECSMEGKRAFVCERLTNIHGARDSDEIGV